MARRPNYGVDLCYCKFLRGYEEWSILAIRCERVPASPVTPSRVLPFLPSDPILEEDDHGGSSVEKEVGPLRLVDWQSRLRTIELKEERKLLISIGDDNAVASYSSRAGESQSRNYIIGIISRFSIHIRTMGCCREMWVSTDDTERSKIHSVNDKRRGGTSDQYLFIVAGGAGIMRGGAARNHLPSRVGSEEFNHALYYGCFGKDNSKAFKTFKKGRLDEAFKLCDLWGYTKEKFDELMRVHWKNFEK
nr:hypothetical protein Iba_chr15cCG5170 [Ipomoea batatas]